MTVELQRELEEIFAARDREHMAPTIEAFLAVLERHPDDPDVLYEVGGAFDTDGQEQLAAGYYRRAIDAGLAGYRLRQCHLQYGSTLRNLGRFEESLAMLDEGLRRFPGSESLVAFRALTLLEAGRADAAVAELLVLLADRLRTDELLRYEPALRGNAAYLAARDADTAR